MRLDVKYNLENDLLITMSCLKRQLLMLAITIFIFQQAICI